MVSDVVFQLLAYRHAPSLNAPSGLRNVYFTFQFYDFPPTISELARLKAAGDEEAQVFFLQRHATSTRHGLPSWAFAHPADVKCKAVALGVLLPGNDHLTEAWMLQC